jgi:hypothetical protein
MLVKGTLRDKKLPLGQGDTEVDGSSRQGASDFFPAPHRKVGVFDNM